MKTVQQWVDENLTAKQKSNFLIELEREGFNEYLTQTEGTLWGAIAGAIIWQSTKQGHKYWEKIANKTPKN